MKIASIGVSEALAREHEETELTIPESDPCFDCSLHDLESIFLRSRFGAVIETRITIERERRRTEKDEKLVLK